MDNFILNGKGQAMPSGVLPVTPEAFGPRTGTEITWLGGAGILLNVRGTTVLIDPLLTGFDMPVLFDCPLRPENVPHLDAILVTHIDNDHFSRETCLKLKDVCGAFHSTGYVAQEMRAAGIPGEGHGIGASFEAGNVRATLTPAKHNWQSGIPEFGFRTWAEEDYCGFLFDTPDGRIWLPGDSRLLESHLHLEQAPDVILFDFSDNDWHIGLEGALKLAAAYPEARLVLIHWGTVDAPDMTPFNANPRDLYERVVNPERIRVLRPGEAMTL